MKIKENLYYYGKVACLLKLDVLDGRPQIEHLIRELNKYEHLTVEWNSGMEENTIEIKTLDNIHLVKSFLPYCLNYVGIPLDKAEF